MDDEIVRKTEQGLISLKPAAGLCDMRFFLQPRKRVLNQTKMRHALF
jgi:hypothetical protein